MEKKDADLTMIHLLPLPAFLVKDGKVLKVNDAAARLFLKEGTEVSSLLQSGQQEYAAFSGGCLCLTITLAGEIQGASVTRIHDMDLFLADQETELKELQLLSLAAQELRQPLSNVILSADQLGPLQDSQEARLCAARLNRGAAQLQRMICNMSDALRYFGGGKLQIRNASSLISEIFEKAQTLTESTGILLTYQGLPEDVFTLVDEEQLERAIYNLISNALKFTPRGGSISGKLQKKGKSLLLTIEDSGSGIADGILGSIYARYRRTPSLEDSRFGLGLGMVLIRAAARTHGGTVLIERLPQGTRVTLTLAIRESQDNMLRSPIFNVDYAGERDHGLLELSESLPPEPYLPEEY